MARQNRRAVPPEPGLLRPAWPRLPEALAAVLGVAYGGEPYALYGGIDGALRAIAVGAAARRTYPEAARSPEEAWERLATRGLIPEAWVDDPVRRFDSDSGDGDGWCDACNGSGWGHTGEPGCGHFDDGPCGIDCPPCPACGGTCRVLLARPPTVAGCVAVAADAAAMAACEAIARQHATDAPRALVWSIVPGVRIWDARQRLARAPERNVRAVVDILARGYALAGLDDAAITIEGPEASPEALA